MDPLSDVLSHVGIQSHWSERFEWGTDWCLAFERHAGMRTYAILRGECWLSVEGMADPIRGSAGDCLLLPGGRSFRVGSDLKLPAANGLRLSEGIDDDGLAERYAGAEFLGLGGHFSLIGEHAALLTDLLPPILHIHSEADKAVLRWTLERLSEELGDSEPGATLVTQQLATMLVVQALRIHLRDVTALDGVGWLYALRDHRMRAALDVMHADPARRWTVQSLAERAGMSRTSFAIRFKGTVGKAPLEYLTHWRMMLACERLEKSSDSIATISLSLGYESESAFSTAFKRVIGRSPRSRRLQPTRSTDHRAF